MLIRKWWCSQPSYVEKAFLFCDVGARWRVPRRAGDPWSVELHRDPSNTHHRRRNACHRDCFRIGGRIDMIGKWFGTFAKSVDTIPAAKLEFRILVFLRNFGHTKDEIQRSLVSGLAGEICKFLNQVEIARRLRNHIFCDFNLIQEYANFTTSYHPSNSRPYFFRKLQICIRVNCLQ